MEAFGAQAVIVTLIIINAGVEAMLYRELRQHRHIGEYQLSLEAHVERHRQFWSDLAKEYPEPASDTPVEVPTTVQGQGDAAEEGAEKGDKAE